MNPIAEDGIVIVNYHYCHPKQGDIFSGVHGILPEDLARQAAAFGEHFEPIGPDRLATARDEQGPRLLVTADDGTRDIFQYALPIWRAASIPAILFCCSRPLLEGRVLDMQKIHFLQARLGRDPFRRSFLNALDALAPNTLLEDPDRLGLAFMYRYDDEETRRFKFLLNTELPYDILEALLDSMFEREFGSQQEAVRHIYMSRDQILRAQDMGFVIGLHTHAHRMLSRLTPEAQRAEIGQCATFFEDLLGEPVQLLSYPYGVRGTYNATTKTILREHRIETAFSLGRAVFAPDAIHDSLEIPRFDVNDISYGASNASNPPADAAPLTTN